MKAIVTNADPVNPRLSTGWLDYSQHAGFATDPARVRSPQDKPAVERAVQYVRGNFFAGETFDSLDQAQAAVEAWCTRTAGMRMHGTTAARPLEVFQEVEAVALLDVPPRYDVPIWRTVKVHRDFHVEIGKALYSVPGEWIGQSLDARADADLVKLFHRGQLVKTHPRQPAGGRRTDPADLPAERVGYAMRDLDRLVATAAGHGPQHRHLRVPVARRSAALDPDAGRLPAARPGPPLRARPGGHRLRHRHWTWTSSPSGRSTRCSPKLSKHRPGTARRGRSPRRQVRPRPAEFRPAPAVRPHPRRRHPPAGRTGHPMTTTLPRHRTGPAPVDRSTRSAPT